ncbi:recombinase family protein [Nonomuraea sp. NPDC000554]|uniref:recombinase family protein n=1 Tax=Nonomuraea sp. NPDC000554 TaxID=3154259 RepID=UPI003331B60A
MTPTPRSRCVIYVRISRDKEGAGLGVKRQEADCRDLAQRMGWEVLELYVDNDISAYTGKPRPDYLRMLDDLKQGRADVVVAWHTDRLHRSMTELEEYIAACAPHEVVTHTVKAGLVDLSTPSGKMVARQLGAVAVYESEHKAERIKAKHLELAKSGKPTGGGYRPYGYRRIYDQPDPPRRIVRIEIVPEEADVIRECARRVLAGEALAGLCRDLNKRGIPTTSTGIWTARQVRSIAENQIGDFADSVRARLEADESPAAVARSLQEQGVPSPAQGLWSTPTLARILVSGRIAGLREHIPRSRHETRRVRTGEIMGQGEWPAIISPADSARLRTLLTDPSRRVSPGATGRYLLTGLIYCDVCKHRMVGRTRQKGVRSYVCDGQPGRPGCGRISVRTDYTDDVIAAGAAKILTSEGFAAALKDAESGPDEGDVLAEIAACEHELEQLAADHGSGVISRIEWMAARKPLQARLEAAKSALGRADVDRVLAGLPADRDGLERFLLDGEVEASRRRSVIAVVLERVWARPVAVRGRKTFDPDRLDPVWRF